MMQSYTKCLAFCCFFGVVVDFCVYVSVCAHDRSKELAVKKLTGLRAPLDIYGFENLTTN